MDIGDQQSLENSLSTFSGHMSNIAQIMKNATRHSIVLLDEIGSGTEPNEGAALAIAIMESIYRSGALMIATTHYGEIKQFAVDHQDFETAAMAFDAKTLTPKYRLLTNAVGDSNAFWIAEKMAIPADVVQTAKEYLKHKTYSFEKEPFEKGKKQPPQQEAKINLIFQKGDLVFSTEHNQRGLFYEYLEQGQAEISIEKHFLLLPHVACNSSQSERCSIPQVMILISYSLSLRSASLLEILNEDLKSAEAVTKSSARTANLSTRGLID